MEVFKMAVGDRYVTIKVDIETGEVEFSSSAGVQADEVRSPEVESVKDEIEGIRRGKKRYLRVGEVIQTTQSPGCVYWDGVRWVKFC
jgi:hypothetical protein